MGLKLAVLLTCFGIFGVIFAPFYFIRPVTVPHYEWLIAMGAIISAVLIFVGIKVIIFEIRMKRFLNQSS